MILGEVNENATSDFTGSVSRASANSLQIFYSASPEIYRLRTLPDTYCRAVTSSAAYFSVHFLILLECQLSAMIFLEVYKVSDVCNGWCQTICFSMWSKECFFDCFFKLEVNGLLQYLSQFWSPCIIWDTSITTFNVEYKKETAEDFQSKAFMYYISKQNPTSQKSKISFKDNFFQDKPGMLATSDQTRKASSPYFGLEFRYLTAKVGIFPS